MMCENVQTIKALAAFNERVQGLLDDGYHKIIDYDSSDLAMVKLRHHNGNRIIIRLYKNECRIIQHTNNVLNYTCKVC